MLENTEGAIQKETMYVLSWNEVRLGDFMEYELCTRLE